MSIPVCNRSSSPRRAVRAAAAGVVVAAGLNVMVGCGGTTAPSDGSGAAPTTQPNVFPSSVVAVPAPTASLPEASPTGPVDVAEHWLVAYRSIGWTDDSPAVWIGHVRPYVTAVLDAQDRRYADAGGGADWQDFVTKQCTSTVSDLGAAIPPESPGTATAVNVQVTGTVHTTCDAGQPDAPTESASATLVITQGPDGSWRVNQRLY